MPAKNLNYALLTPTFSWTFVIHVSHFAEYHFVKWIDQITKIFPLLDKLNLSIETFSKHFRCLSLHFLEPLGYLYSCSSTIKFEYLSGKQHKLKWENSWRKLNWWYDSFNEEAWILFVCLLIFQRNLAHLMEMVHDAFFSIPPLPIAHLYLLCKYFSKGNG